MSTNPKSQGYSILNLTWLIAVKNNPSILSKLDNLHFSHQAIVNSLFDLKTGLVGTNAEVLMVGTSKVFPLNDFILSKSAKQLEEVVDEEISGLIKSGRFPEVLRTSVISYDKNSIDFLDLITPSNLVLETRKNNHMEFYVIQMFVVLNESSAQIWADNLSRKLNSGSNSISATIEMFRKLDICKELMGAISIVPDEKIALVPLFGNEDLLHKVRSTVKNYRGARA